jgi:hypothetical protein
MKISQGEKVGIIGLWKFVYTDNAGNFLRSEEVYNLTPDVMLEALAEQTAGINTVNLGDNIYIALGTGTTAPSASDTTLDTETVRKAVSDASRNTTTGKITVFFNSSEVSGTYEEIGLFSNGKNVTASGSADTGILNSRVLNTITLGAGENLTVTFNITFSR